MDRRLEITRLIHENFNLIINFAYSQPIINEVLESNFKGEWKYLWMSLPLGEHRADRALLEMATQLRILDDIDFDKELSKHWSDESFGRLTVNNDQIKNLTLRQAVNKIVHASEFNWDFSAPKEPKVICRPIENEDWIEAEIPLLPLCGVIGQLMF